MSSSNSCLDNISRSPPSGIFRVLHKGGYAKSSTGSVNPLTSSLFILKIKNLFNVKYLLSDRLHTRIVNKFSCPSCNACYVDETSWHFSTRVHEHMSSNRSYHVYKHLQAWESCRTSCNLDEGGKGGGGGIDHVSWKIKWPFHTSRTINSVFHVSREKRFHKTSFSYFG